ncbi:hypothetical protein PR001_g417 [Phytophthora rubi]|uniref:Uncharacterized protein n=1 Tax=Phytophthora rubi TaxID=129364 RepID=A0A6A3PG82_9STRA|nr:hypothetical protein PR001_g417 [Phytophthora rubi]
MNVVADALSRAPAAVKAVTGRERVGERRAPAATIADEDGKTEDDEPVYCTLALPTTSEDGKKRLVGSESTLPPPVAMATTSAKCETATRRRGCRSVPGRTPSSRGDVGTGANHGAGAHGQNPAPEPAMEEGPNDARSD